MGGRFKEHDTAARVLGPCLQVSCCSLAVGQRSRTPAAVSSGRAL